MKIEVNYYLSSIMEEGQLIKKVEKQSGYLLEKEDKNSIDDLNKTPKKIIEVARKLTHEIDRFELFSFLTSEPNHNVLRGFIKDVVENEIPVNTWMKGRILLPDISLNDQLTKRINQIIPSNLDYTHIVLPRYEAWEQASCIGGSPAILDQKATYKTPHISGFHNFPDVKIKPKSEFSPSVIHARWIAQRIARYLNIHSHLPLPSLEVMKGELRQHNAEKLWIPEVEVALNGLAKEIESDMIEPNSVPGFIGPDEFYTLTFHNKT